MQVTVLFLPFSNINNQFLLCKMTHKTKSFEKEVGVANVVEKKLRGLRESAETRVDVIAAFRPALERMLS